jgi:hypothetical protein
VNDWENLAGELDVWAKAGRVATLWWRDDDAAAPSPALDRLLELAETHGLPLALALIPAAADDTLARRLDKVSSPVTPLQHGFAHQNHARTGEKKVELGAGRPVAAVLDELARGRERMAALFGEEPPAVLVPPWNRIAAELIPELAGLGFTGLSTYGPRITAHADIMRWRAPRGFLGTAPALDLLVGHLRARRQGAADPEEASGLLTHHLAHDPACWSFLERLLPILVEHPAARIASAGEIFSAAAAAETGDAAA